jgi:hypothetical protein
LKYGDLVQFDPIETVIELRDADKHDRARTLIETYVVSDEMARRLTSVIAAHLDFANLDPKGMFVVGNYGTGKSHLMAVVSALAEEADLLPALRHEGVRTAFAPFSGRYKVARFEIGAVKTSLRDIVVREIEKHLAKWGVDYKFPAVDRLTNHKDAIEAMLAAVEEKHPGKGVLVVVDELLDYLKGMGAGAIDAFNFLRELGEASGNGRFRFIAGVQESLISSPNFGFLADLIKKISARFVEVWITREDLAFVVETRLLGKSAEQRERVRKHLERFMPLFPTMSAEADAFIRLFPVHPRYLKVFEQIDIAEKRQALSTLSQEISGLLDTDVPDDGPGVIAYDSYWRVIKKTPTFLSNPTVAEVEQRSSIVAAKVETSLSKPQYRAAASRIVDALSVYRLAVGGIRSPIGLTATDLRDDLSLMLPVPEKDPDFLATTIESVLNDIRLAVAGQFLSRNDSGQYFLDVDKSIDFDARVADKVKSLEPVPDIFDRYYFDLLTRILETADTTHVSGMQIWSYQLVWPGHNVTRPGYLFFGSPNERSTAQPPRSFYVYFLAHFAPTAFDDAQRDDEVFFRLARPAPEVLDRLKQYAAATELSGTSSGEEKAQYRSIAEGHRRVVLRWLSDNIVQAFDVTFAGETRPLAAAVAEASKASSMSTPRDLTNAVAGAKLSPTFDRQFPGYPSFPALAAPITEESRAQTATEGLRYLAGTIRSLQGTAVADGLGLLEDGVINPTKSPYATHVRKTLAEKPEGHVLNRSELVASRDGVDLDPVFGLEPELLAVVLAAMAYRGAVVISVAGQVIDASSLAAAAGLGAEAMGRFKTVQGPKATPITGLKSLFDMLALNPALLDLDLDAAAATLQAAVAQALKDVLGTTSRIGTAQLGGAPLWDDAEAPSIQARFDTYRSFLDGLTPMNTAGKLKQYRTSAEDLSAFAKIRAEILAAEQRLLRADALAAQDAYLRDAREALVLDDPMRAVIVSALESAREGVLAEASSDSGQPSLSSVQAAYIQRYLGLHNAARLDHHGDEVKVRLMNGQMMKRLNLLETVAMLPTGLADLKRDLASIVTCRQVDAKELENHAFCQACRYRPAVDTSADATARLNTAEAVSSA